MLKLSVKNITTNTSEINFMTSFITSSSISSKQIKFMQILGTWRNNKYILFIFIWNDFASRKSTTNSSINKAQITLNFSMSKLYFLKVLNCKNKNGYKAIF